MNSGTKVIGICIFILVLVLAAAGFFLLRLSAPKGQPAAQSTNGIFPGSTSINVTTGSSAGSPSAQSSTPATLDLTAAYQALFTQLNAKELAFTAIDASSTESGDIYALYSNDVSIAKQFAPAGADLSLQVAMIDLNYDGAPEAVVYENLPGFCGVAGCALDVYQKETGKWVKLFSTFAASDEIAVSMTLSNQYADIFVPQQGAVGSQTEIERYVWNGGGYKQGGIAAAWNGSGFQTLAQ